MRGFYELRIDERVAIYGGKDANVSKTVELIGYLIGRLVKSIIDVRDKKEEKPMNVPIYGR